MKREVWDEVQTEEFAYHEAKDAARVLEYKLPYWRKLIESLPAAVQFSEATRVVDVGCGGASVLLALEGGHRIGIDPLMGRYTEQFPYLKDYTDVRWIEGAAEEVELDEPQDVVFAINSFDHVFDAAKVVERIHKWLRPGGYAVVTMNTHNTKFFCNWYRRFFRLIDHHHPFQFTATDVLALFKGFSPVEVRNIDDLWLPFEPGWYRDVLRRPREDKRRYLKAALNPFKWPMGFSKFFLGMPPHRTKPGQRSIYSDTLYVLRKGESASA